MRLRGLAGAQAGGAQRGAGEREDAALAVRARDERTADAELRIAELSEQGAGPPEPEPDPESAAFGQGGEGGLVGAHEVGIVRPHGAGIRRRAPLTRTRHSRLRSSS